MSNDEIRDTIAELRESAPVDPMTIKCRACNSPPGQRCYGVLSSQPRVEPHAMRVNDAKNGGRP